jgi:NAD(P) transhydrogenase subunit alpha
MITKLTGDAMKIGVPKELSSGETRVALTPESIKKLLTKEGCEILVEAGAGAASGFSDDSYSAAGAKIVERNFVLSETDLVVRVNMPPEDEVASLKSGSMHLSFLDPYNEKPLLEKLASHNITAISMEMIPRTTLAQKMDALSSQASLAGYAAVVIAAEKLDKIFPMMMTPSGTISPARVFIIGAGVAGLQAIATAKRMGARVEAFDTRPVVEEQVQSLGAKFVKVDLGETGQTKDGYAKALTEEQLAKQREVMKKHCIQSDVVITTAKLFGRKAPVIITSDTIREMKKGAVVIDLAVETGGNVEGSVPDETVDVNGVKIVGISNLPGTVSYDASLMYGNNIANFILHFWNDEAQTISLDLGDEILKGCVISNGGKIVHESIQKIYSQE